MKGISIDNIKTPDTRISGLYIKLNKKLIVTINEINILNTTKDISQSTNSLNSLDVILNKIPYLYIFFDTIDIKSIKYEDEEGKLKYSNKNIFIDTKYLNLQTRSIAYDDGNIELDFEWLSLEDYDVTLSGKLNGSLHNSSYSFDGRYNIYEVVGDVGLNFSKDMLTYEIASDEFGYDKFENLMDNISLYANLGEDAKSWIYKNIKAHSYELISFNGRIDTKNFNIFPNEMRGKAVAKNVNVTFNKDVSAAKVEEAEVDFIKDELIILVKNGTFEGLKLNDANVTISNLIDNDNLNIKVNLFTNELFEDRIRKIVKAFGVEVPVIQLSGNNDAYIGIFVNVEPFGVDIVGDIKVFDSNLTIADTHFYSKYAEIELKNDTLNFRDSNLKMKNIFDLNANATLHASDGILFANTTINEFGIKANNTTVVQMENISTEATMLIIDGGVKFEIDEYDVNLTFAENSIFEINSLEKVYHFVPLAKEYGVKNGTISISTNDFEDFYGLAHIYDIKNIPLMHQNKSIDMFEGGFVISKNGLNVKSFNDFFNININEEINVSIKNVDLLITDEMLKKNNQTIGGSNSEQIPIHFLSTNASIIIEPLNITVYSNNISVNVDKNNDIAANFYDNDGFIDVQKSSDSLTIYANDFTSSFVNSIANKQIFDGGKFSTYVEGNSTEYFGGTFSFTDSALKEFALMNNLVAFLNTIPALLTLNDPKFSSSGYPVKKGFVQFVRMDDFLYIPNVFLEGYSTDISALGYVELDTKNIYMDIEISTLKALGEIINFIPLVNYIVLGEDGKITIQLAVRGTYDNPDIQTSILEGVAKSPLNVLKRVLQTPSRLFQKLL